MVYIFPNSLSTFSGDKKIALNAGYVEISNETFDDLVETKKMWKNGKIVNDPTYAKRKAEQEKEAEKLAIINQINEFKSLLASTDYLAIKHSEGWITDNDYALTKAQRQAYRDEINKLEQELIAEDETNANETV